MNNMVRSKQVAIISGKTMATVRPFTPSSRLVSSVGQGLAGAIHSKYQLGLESYNLGLLSLVFLNPTPDVDGQGITNVVENVFVRFNLQNSSKNLASSLLSRSLTQMFSRNITQLLTTIRNSGSTNFWHEWDRLRENSRTEHTFNAIRESIRQERQLLNGSGVRSELIRMLERNDLRERFGTQFQQVRQNNVQRLQKLNVFLRESTARFSSLEKLELARLLRQLTWFERFQTNDRLFRDTHTYLEKQLSGELTNVFLRNLSQNAGLSLHPNVFTKWNMLSSVVRSSTSATQNYLNPFYGSTSATQNYLNRFFTSTSATQNYLNPLYASTSATQNYLNRFFASTSATQNYLNPLYASTSATQNYLNPFYGSTSATQNYLNPLYASTSATQNYLNPLYASTSATQNYLNRFFASTSATQNYLNPFYASTSATQNYLNPFYASTSAIHSLMTMLHPLSRMLEVKHSSSLERVMFNSNVPFHLRSLKSIGNVNVNLQTFLKNAYHSFLTKSFLTDSLTNPSYISNVNPNYSNIMGSDYIDNFSSFFNQFAFNKGSNRLFATLLSNLSFHLGSQVSPNVAKLFNQLYMSSGEVVPDALLAGNRHIGNRRVGEQPSVPWLGIWGNNDSAESPQLQHSWMQHIHGWSSLRHLQRFNTQRFNWNAWSKVLIQPTMLLRASSRLREWFQMLSSNTGSGSNKSTIHSTHSESSRLLGLHRLTLKERALFGKSILQGLKSFHAQVNAGELAARFVQIGLHELTKQSDWSRTNRLYHFDDRTYFARLVNTVEKMDAQELAELFGSHFVREWNTMRQANSKQVNAGNGRDGESVNESHPNRSHRGIQPFPGQIQSFWEHVTAGRVPAIWTDLRNRSNRFVQAMAAKQFRLDRRRYASSSAFQAFHLFQQKAQAAKAFLPMVSTFADLQPSGGQFRDITTEHHWSSLQTRWPILAFLQQQGTIKSEQIHFLTEYLKRSGSAGVNRLQEIFKQAQLRLHTNWLHSNDHTFDHFRILFKLPPLTTLGNIMRSIDPLRLFQGNATHFTINHAHANEQNVLFHRIFNFVSNQSNQGALGIAGGNTLSTHSTFARSIGLFAAQTFRRLANTGLLQNVKISDRLLTDWVRRRWLSEADTADSSALDVQPTILQNKRVALNRDSQPRQEVMPDGRTPDIMLLRKQTTSGKSEQATETIQQTVQTETHISKTVSSEAQPLAMDFDKLVDKLYREFEKKWKFERQRRGL